MDWPRDGRVVLRVKAKESAYWKAANLDGFDGTRWVRAGLRPTRAPSRRAARRRARPWRQTHPCRGQAGIAPPVGRRRQHALDSTGCAAQVPSGARAPGRSAAQLHAATPTTPASTCPARAGQLPPPARISRRDRAVPVHPPARRRRRPGPGVEMVFRPFGSHEQPVALAPTATVAEQGDRAWPTRSTPAPTRWRGGSPTAPPTPTTSPVASTTTSRRPVRLLRGPPRRAVPLEASCSATTAATASSSRAPWHSSCAWAACPRGWRRVLARFADPRAASTSCATSTPTRGSRPTSRATAGSPSTRRRPSRPRGRRSPRPGHHRRGRRDRPRRHRRHRGRPEQGRGRRRGAELVVVPGVPGARRGAAVILLVLLAFAVVALLRRRRGKPADPRLAELERALRRTGRAASIPA